MNKNHDIKPDLTPVIALAATLQVLIFALFFITIKGLFFNHKISQEVAYYQPPAHDMCFYQIPIDKCTDYEGFAIGSNARTTGNFNIAISYRTKQY